MKNIMKKRLAILIAFALVLPTIIGMLPVNTIQADAASYEIGTSYGRSQNSPLMVELGSKFGASDLIYVYKNDKYSGTLAMSKGTYSSSNKAVAKVDKSGNVTAKSKGLAIITAKYKGKTVKMYLKVVDKNYTKSSQAKKLKKAANTLKKAAPSTVKTSNGYKLVKALKNYNKVLDKYSAMQVGQNTHYISGAGTMWTMDGTILVVPEATKYLTINAKSSLYQSKYAITSTVASKKVKISSAKVASNKKSLSITFNRKVSAENMLAANLYYVYNTEKAVNKSKIDVFVGVYDETEGISYAANMTIKKGSKKATLKLTRYDWEKGKYVNANFQKGHTYTIGTKTTWGNSKEIVVK